MGGLRYTESEVACMICKVKIMPAEAGELRDGLHDKLPDEMEVVSGTTYLELAQIYGREYKYDIVLVYVDGNTLQELYKPICKDVSVQFVTTARVEGYETYRRSLCLLLLKAVHDLTKEACHVRVYFSLGNAYYCRFEGERRLEADFLDVVEKRMRDIVALRLPIMKRSVSTDHAVELFGAHGMTDKEKLFTYRRVSRVNLYSMDGYEDYFYGYMVPDAGYVPYFKLEPYDDGFLLMMPERKRPDQVGEKKDYPRLYDTLKQAVSWGERQNIQTVGDLNEQITHEDMREIILVQEAYQEQRIEELARRIVERGNVRFILIAGPSSSGKTTFSHRLSVWLRVFGLTPHPIAVDNYFVDREQTPRDENGNYNFECIEAIDVKQFREDMLALLSGETVALPTFNFKTGKREYSGRKKRLHENDVLVIEGIHCLNPILSQGLDTDRIFKIYISALTQLNVDEHNRIPSTDGRLIRRIIRDARTRGTRAEETIRMWPSVRRGEEQNIFPYQEEADAMFNSSLSYELAVLKQDVEPLLFGVEKDSPAYAEAKRLLKFFDYFVGIHGDIVPRQSILREFIGGGCFRI